MSEHHSTMDLAQKTTAGLLGTGAGAAAMMDKIEGMLSIASLSLGIIWLLWLFYDKIKMKLNERRAKKGELQRRSTD